MKNWPQQMSCIEYQKMLVTITAWFVLCQKIATFTKTSVFFRILNVNTGTTTWAVRAVTWTFEQNQNNNFSSSISHYLSKLLLAFFNALRDTISSWVTVGLLGELHEVLSSHLQNLSTNFHCRNRCFLQTGKHYANLSL